MKDTKQLFEELKELHQNWVENEPKRKEIVLHVLEKVHSMLSEELIVCERPDGNYIYLESGDYEFGSPLNGDYQITEVKVPGCYRINNSIYYKDNGRIVLVGNGMGKPIELQLSKSVIQEILKRITYAIAKEINLTNDATDACSALEDIVK